METKKVGATTRQQAFYLLSAALRAALKLNMVSFNAANSVEPPAVPRRAEREILDRDQLQVLLDAAESDEEIGALWVTLTLSGARLSEVLALRWRDVDFAEGRISIQR